MAMKSRHGNRIKPRHVFATLVLMGQAPILGALVAGWLISGLIYGAALCVERARGHGRNWRQRQRGAPRESSARSRIGRPPARGVGDAIALHSPARR
jgi:hypothetical protein